MFCYLHFWQLILDDKKFFQLILHKVTEFALTQKTAKFISLNFHPNFLTLLLDGASEEDKNRITEDSRRVEHVTEIFSVILNLHFDFSNCHNNCFYKTMHLHANI